MPDRDERKQDRHQAHGIGVNERERGRPHLKSAAPQASRRHNRDRIAEDRAAGAAGRKPPGSGLKIVRRVGQPR
jgi:hypothetical protein